jgi:hypothetical protein
MSALRVRAQKLIAPQPYALIGGGALLLFIADYFSITVEQVHGFAWGALVTFLAAALGLAALLYVASSAGISLRILGKWTSDPRIERWELAARAIITLIMALMALASFLLFIAGLYSVTGEQPAEAYLNDVISFSAANAHAVLAGHNPYTDDANFIPTLIAYPKAPPTPIQGPIFGSGYDYPLQSHVFAIDQLYIQDPTRYAAAFDPHTLHSYPALAFLIYIPLFLLGIQNVMWLNIIAYVALLVWLIRVAPREERGWALFTGLAALTITFGSLLLETEVICLLFLLPAWQMRGATGWRGWKSAILLGLACAFKQYCWYFAPLFLLDVWLRQGWRLAIRQALIAAAAFLLPNLPFIVASPSAWFQSMLLPLTAATFPQGMGLVTLALGRWLPALPKITFAILEFAALGGTLWLYARRHDRLREAAPLLALVPFFFAFRSPPNYFAFAPWFALFAWYWLSRSRASASAVSAAAAVS